MHAVVYHGPNQKPSDHHLDVGRFVTHHFAINEFEAAYDTFARAADTGALKLVITP